jgi:Zn-dependent alcohol dehydrogenase
MENERQVPRCTGNCKACLQVQRQYCATQLSYNNAMAIDALRSEMAELAKKLNDMNSENVEVVDPTEKLEIKD